MMIRRVKIVELSYHYLTGYFDKNIIKNSDIIHVSSVCKSRVKIKRITK